MNNNITKVNIPEIEELITKLRSVSTMVDSHIKEYQKNLKTIENAGYLVGVAEISINASFDKISKTCTEFKDYATRLASSLSEVTKQTEQIESSEEKDIMNILNEDPTKFAGIVGATTAFGVGAFATAMDGFKTLFNSNPATNAATILNDQIDKIVNDKMVVSGTGNAVEGTNQSSTTTTPVTPTTMEKPKAEEKPKVEEKPKAEEKPKVEEKPKAEEKPTTNSDVLAIKRTTAVKDGGKLTASAISTRDKIVVQAKELGFNEAATAAILANMEHESTFNPKASGDGGTSYGLIQWHADRKNNLMNYCSKNNLDHTTVEAQMSFMMDEISKGGGEAWTGTLEKLQSVPNTAEGASEAAKYFCVKYERPYSSTSKGNARAEDAAVYFKELTT